MIRSILDFAAVAHPEQEIVSRLIDGSIWRYNYAECHQRVAAAATMLKAYGIAQGDRVSSLAWNTHRHFELFYAVPAIGGVLHTANPRLTDEQIAYTINHARSSLLFFDRSFLSLVERLKPELTHMRHFIMLDEPNPIVQDALGADCYETRLAACAGPHEWPELDENAAAILCYTSGTTGDPKGVLYSHRSVVLHAMAGGLSGALGLSAFDCVMPCSSLYHATGWGLPFIAPINGCKFVLPCDRMDGASLHELIAGEGVTVTGGVPTIWTMYLTYLKQSEQSPVSLDRVIIGGSAVPRAMAETFETLHGVKVLQLWGMTETSPLGVVSTPTPAAAAMGEDALKEQIWTRQGRLQFGIELKVVDEDGRELPRDGMSSGSLRVRGPWTVDHYYDSEENGADDDGWFDTGDIATLDRFGFMRITDRAKDVIKSGGEWISSIDIENAVMALPGVRIAGVIAVYHPKWEERPLLVVEPQSGFEINPDDVRAHLEAKVAKWWLPDQIFMGEVPLNANGKVDKKRLRDTYGQQDTGLCQL